VSRPGASQPCPLRPVFPQARRIALKAGTYAWHIERFAIDLFRNTYALNFENIGRNGVVQPSVSLWFPNA
jgi:hypothetical protein